MPGFDSSQPWPDPAAMGRQPRRGEDGVPWLAERPGPPGSGAGLSEGEAALVEQLRQVGVTDEQLAVLAQQRTRWQRVRALRAYESRGLNFYRLCFARWLVEQGRISEQPATPDGPPAGSPCAPVPPRQCQPGFWRRLRGLFWPPR